MADHRIRRGYRHRRVLLVGLSVALVALDPGIAAGTESNNAMRGTVSASGPLAALYDYTRGSAASWSATAEFDAGTHSGTTAQDVADTLTLDRVGPAGVAEPDSGIPWWDPDWGTRDCYTIDHTAGNDSVTEYPVILAFPSAGRIAAGLLQANLGDLRAVAADGTTLLALWVEDDDTAWVQVDAVAAGATTFVCLYYGYAPGAAVAPPNHTQEAVFTYTTPKPVYYTVSAAYTGSQSVAVASYVDGNVIEQDTGTTTTATLGDGDLTTFASNNAATEYRVTGPIAARGLGGGLDTLIPVSWAGTRFVIPSNREQQIVSFLAPWSGGSVSIYAGSDTTPLDVVAVSAGTADSWTEAPVDAVDAGEAIVVESTVPILVHHATTIGGDAFAVHPVSAQDWFGVSSVAHLGFDGDQIGGTATDVQVTRSASGSTTVSDFRGVEVAIAGSAGGGGADDAVRLRVTGGPAGAAVGAVSQDDGDGQESATFLPESALGSRYLVVTDSGYLAIACADPGVAITVTDGGGATSSFSCNLTSAVGHALETADRDTSATRAIEVTGSGTFFLMYEDRATEGESNVLGMKQGRQVVWPEPAVAANGAEGLYAASGTWESATVDTGNGDNVFGTITFSGAVASGVTGLEVTVATSNVDPPTSFVGPDGTATTAWTLDDLPSALDFAHDGDRYLRVRVAMTTSDRAGATPELGDLTVGYQLPLVDRDASGRAAISVAGSTTASVDYLLRVTTASSALDGSTSTLEDVVVGNDPDLTDGALRMVNLPNGLDSVQWSTGGAGPSPVAFGTADPHSVVLDHTRVAGGPVTIDVTWNLNVVGTSSIIVQSDLTVEITAP
jgi:hypothetical protein